jgi:hypothetical protein
MATFGRDPYTGEVEVCYHVKVQKGRKTMVAIAIPLKLSSSPGRNSIW